jgi:tRNA A58 N-methylase Trm61
MNRAELDAIELMLRDLNTRHEEIRHRAAFRGCTRELISLQQELVKYLMAKKSSLSSR